MYFLMFNIETFILPKASIGQYVVKPSFRVPLQHQLDAYEKIYAFLESLVRGCDPACVHQSALKFNQDNAGFIEAFDVSEGSVVLFDFRLKRLVNPFEQRDFVVKAGVRLTA